MKMILTENNKQSSYIFIPSDKMQSFGDLFRETVKEEEGDP